MTFHDRRLRFRVIAADVSNGLTWREARLARQERKMPQALENAMKAEFAGTWVRCEWPDEVDWR